MTEVRELALTGAKSETIVNYLDCADALKDVGQRFEFDRVFRKAHAEYELKLVKRIQKETLFRGKSLPLLAAARNQLGWDKKGEPALTGWEKFEADRASAVHSLEMVLQKLHAKALAEDPSRAYSAACPSCAGVMVCAPCESDPSRRLRLDPRTGEEVKHDPPE